MTHHAGYSKGKEGGGGIFNCKKKDIKNKKILYFLFTYHFLVFVSVLFGCFCFTERSKSFFGNQCTTIDDWLIFLMHINAKIRV